MSDLLNIISNLILKAEGWKNDGSDEKGIIAELGKYPTG